MALYPYRSQLVVDPDNPRNVVAGGSVSIYDSEDTSKTTLLALTDPNGVPIPNPFTSYANGLTPAFVTTSPEVLWVSGSYTDYFQSYKGMRDEAAAAREAAETAAASAGAEAAAVADAAIGDATAEATAAKAAAETAASNAAASATAAANSASLVGAPADTAIAAAVNNSASATKAALNATFATVYKPEKYGAKGDGTTNDAAAIQAAFDAVGTAGGGTVVFSGGKTYAIAAKLTLPAIAPIHLRMETGAQLLATATMTAMIEKPTGGYGSGSIYEGLKLNGGLLAERCLDIQQSQGLKIKSPDLLRFTYAGADFGRTAGQNYELEWTGGAVTGRLGGDTATAAQLADYGIHTGPSGVTDNFFSDIKIKNVKTHVREQGQADVWHMIHCYAYPFANTPGANDWSDGTVQFDVSGYHNRIVSCYIDTAAVGIRVTGSFVRITDTQFLWPSNHTPSYAPLGIDVQAPGTSIIGNAFYPGKPDSQDVTAIKVSATAYRPVIIGNQFGGGAAGYVAAGPLDVNAAAGGTIHGNHWDGGSINNSTNNRTRSTIASDLGDAGHVVQRWYGTNPGQMLAVGSGATGYMRLWQETAGGGFQIGATGNKFGVNGAAPVVTQDANTDFETIMTRFGFATTSTVRPHRTGLNPRSADTTITTQAGEVQSVDAVAGPVSITLPATTTPGHSFIIKKTDGSANAVTVVGTIDGVANYVLPARWNFVRVVSTSSSGSWLIVGKG